VSQAKHRYYDKRQVVVLSNVPEEQFEERIILCVPNFAWRVARSFLARQGHWESTYASAFFDEYYLSPDEETMDKIKASIDAALAEDDMSCDLREGLDEIANAIGALDISVDCGDGGTGCGAGGAGATETEPSDFDDDGSTPPEGFPDYNTYDEWKCGIAKLVLDQIKSDLNYVKGLAVTEISATLLGFALLTPIPFDDISVLVGVIIAWAVEDILDDLIDAVLTELGIEESDILCGLYNAINAGTASNFLDSWATTNLSTLGAFLFSFFINNDSVNRLFEEGNQILPSNDCSGCGAVGVWEEGGLGTITSQSTNGTLLEVAGEFGQLGNNPELYWCQILLDGNAAGPYEVDSFSISGFTDHGQCPGVSIWFYTNQGGTPQQFCNFDDVVGSVIYPTRQFIITSDTPFSAEFEFTQG